MVRRGSLLISLAVCTRTANNLVSLLLLLLPQPTLLLKLLRHLPGRHPGLRVQQINLLKREVGRFGIAEVDERDESEVCAHEDQVRFPLQPVDDDGGDHDDDEVLRIYTSACAIDLSGA